MSQVAANIDCIRADNPSPMTLDGTNCFFVTGQNEAVLIDVGPDADTHLAALVHYLRDRDLRLRAILLTHTHADHTGGLAALRRRVSAPVYAFREGYDERLHDGQRLALGPGTLDVLHTPGHSGDCVCFFHVDTGVLFAGDTILGFGTSVIAPPEGDVSDYLDSLERLRRLPARVIAPGHGPLVLDPLAKIDEYIQHRLMRERQIIAQLQGGPKSVGELVKVIYQDVDPQLHGAAAWTVSAHLRRLIRAGTVKAEGERFALAAGG